MAVSHGGGGGGVDSIYYVPNFVSAQEGERLERAVEGEGGEGGEGPGGKGRGRGKREGVAEWKNLHKRRLQIHGGIPHASGMVEEELPAFLREGRYLLKVCPGSNYCTRLHFQPIFLGGDVSRVTVRFPRKRPRLPFALNKL